jgi:molybdopterin-containing oxidoreductase family iron-sulfur binding subunit
MENDDDVTRRTFLKALGASIALAGLDGCTRMPAERILPFVTQPAAFTPGVPVHYATSMVLDGYATGLVVETHEGRPTKIEGNPGHPASLGAAGVFEQASLLQLYDPNRARAVRSGASTSSWAPFAAAFSPAVLRNRTGARGAGLALLMEPTSSTVVASLLEHLRALYPAMGVHYYSPLATPGESSGTSGAGGGRGAVIPHYDLRDADVIVTFAADVLAAGPFNLRHAREFADGRRDPLSGMNRLYAAESNVTITGSSADHRFRCRPSEIEQLMARLHAMLVGAATASATTAYATTADARTAESAWLAAVAADLRSHAGRGLVIAGGRESARTRALAAAINDVLGNTGRTVWYGASPLLGAGDPASSLASLLAAMQRGAVDTLVVLGGNPSYASPGAVAFGDAMRRVENTAYLGLYENETARDATWFVPAAHYMETWDDARAYDGTLSIVQPMLQPLFGGKSAVEVLAAMSGVTEDPLTLVRYSWRRLHAALDDAGWEAAVARGYVANTASPRVTFVPPAALTSAPIAPPSHNAPPDPAIEVLFTADARVHDGSFSNNGWLQELPDPVTKLTWDNAAHVSPATAHRAMVATGDIVLIRSETSVLRIPVLIVPGHADDAVTLHLGYGRTGAEEVARGVGADAYGLWPAPGSFVLPRARIERAAGAAPHAFAITQEHWTMEGRDQARTATAAAYRAAPAQAGIRARRELTIYDADTPAPSANQWAMTIDLGTCTGCSACVVACQAENNIPVVGRDDVAKSREMHWIRLDRYRQGSIDDPEFVTQPMLCQHCEHAPCEYVCPVGATDHSPDGLNEMVYNRCVGTRFCSNNCPYKVRRFNWFDYSAEVAETERLAHNPDVTVRDRGVMEKCTMCVQRIREAEISAERAGTPLRGNTVKTACQQACPANAIVFGSLTEPGSELARRRDEPRAYSVLAELGTEPRIRYLAQIRNPNPALESHP